MKFFKKNWKNLLFAVVIALLLIPQTGMPIKVFLNRIMAFSPSKVAEVDQIVLNEYNWSLVTLENKKVNFAQSEGKVVVVNLWATWCPPCIAEMPSLQKLYESYGNRVDFYFVTSEANEKPLEFMTRNSYNFPVFREFQPMPEVLRSRSIPATYLISKNGTIVIEEKGAANWNSEKVRQLLDELLQE